MSNQGQIPADRLRERQPPKKILHPRLSDEAVCVMLSSFGGGMVQGDQVALELDCRTGARLLLRTQANSRVFKNTRAKPPPFTSPPAWRTMEAFAFRHYANHCEIRHADQLLLTDPFEITPESQDVRGAGSFGEANLLLNLYAVGRTRDLLERALGSLATERSALTQVHPLVAQTSAPGPGFLCSLVHLEDRPLSIFRALGKTRGDFDAVFARLQAELRKPEWLNGGETLLPSGVGQL